MYGDAYFLTNMKVIKTNKNFKRESGGRRRECGAICPVIQFGGNPVREKITSVSVTHLGLAYETRFALSHSSPLDLLDISPRDCLAVRKWRHVLFNAVNLSNPQLFVFPGRVQSSRFIWKSANWRPNRRVEKSIWKARINCLIFFYCEFHYQTLTIDDSNFFVRPN